MKRDPYHYNEAEAMALIARILRAPDPLPRPPADYFVDGARFWRRDSVYLFIAQHLGGKAKPEDFNAEEIAERIAKPRGLSFSQLRGLGFPLADYHGPHFELYWLQETVLDWDRSYWQGIKRGSAEGLRSDEEGRNYDA